MMSGLPDIEYYNPDAMKPADRDEFVKWYEENRSQNFDLQR